MSDSIRIRPARHPELPALARLIRHRLPDLMGSHRRLGGEEIEAHLSTLLPDGALILATRERRLAGLAALDLAEARLLALYLDPERARADTARALINAIEKQATNYGVETLHCQVKPQARAFLERLGYVCQELEAGENRPLKMSKSLLTEENSYLSEIFGVLDELNIPRTYGVEHRLRLVAAPDNLVSVGSDVFGRDQQLTPEAGQAWVEMREAARHQNIELQLVSGFRSVNYQAGIIRKKLAQGEEIGEILKSSAAPGFSEHHSGRAVDLNTPGVTILTPQFARSRAYTWLRNNAGLFGFRESFVKGNRHSLEWEPWHWCYRGRPGSHDTSGVEL